MASKFMDNVTEHLGQLQTGLQACRSQISQFQMTVQSWDAIQTTTIDRVIPELEALVKTLELQSPNSTVEKRLRSLSPEVTRLIKLLQIDWQFWQAARQADRMEQRQKQLSHHLQQLDQLLEVMLEAIGVF